MLLRPTSVFLSDVECITQTMVKQDPSRTVNLDRDPPQESVDEILALCANWTSATWDELDWYKIKDMAVREILDKRKRVAASAQGASCISCPDFVKHVSRGQICVDTMHFLALSLTYCIVCDATRRMVDQR